MTDRAENSDDRRFRARKLAGEEAWDEALPPDVRLRLRWLGQAGFLVETREVRILIDPYLSDSLAEKYRGKPYPHRRMAPAPAAPEALGRIDLYFATHSHTDHLDPGTVAPIAALCPDCRFIVPAAGAGVARERGVPASRLLAADAFAAMSVGGIGVYPIPSAHEELLIDEAGHHRFLGYILSVAGVNLYHSGDCVPYPGLAENLAPFDIDIGLLPINGRDERRRAAGIPGNFTLEEAASLADASHFHGMIGHHFGMFDFNTIDPAEARAWLENRRLPGMRVAEIGLAYEIMAP
ncbi:MAG: MBL fold metallo-hydrolase [Spirochaetales bacterium]